MLFRIVTGEDWNKIMHDCMVNIPSSLLVPRLSEMRNIGVSSLLTLDFVLKKYISYLFAVYITFFYNAVYEYTGKYSINLMSYCSPIQQYTLFA